MGESMLHGRCSKGNGKEEWAAMRESVKGILGKALALFVAAVLVSAGALPILGAKEDALASADGMAGDNGWQVVSGGYDAEHKTSEGIQKDQLGNYGFIESPDGSVRVNKTVEPTGVEDEFIVHLSVDSCAVSAQQTDYKSFFETAPYEGVTSNWAHSMTPGTVVGKPNGSPIKITGDPNSTYGKSAVFDIQYPAGKTIAKNVKLSWDKANKTTILLEIDETHNVLIGVEVDSGSNNTLVLSKEAYDAINKKIEGSAQQGPAPTLNTVTDIMGDNIEYLGSASADAGSASFNDDTSTLTWNPQYSASAKKVAGEPEHHYEYTASGAVAKHTVIQRTWYYGAASMTYKVRLKTKGLNSSYDPEVISNPYLTNKQATLDYSGSAYDIDANQFIDKSHVKVDFPKPQVKGITYDLRVLKTDEDGMPLAGATFELTRTWTDSDGNHYTDPVADNLTSDENGYVTVTGLPWGKYTLTETKAPDDFVISENPSCTFDLCYTTDPTSLTASTLSSSEDNRAMLNVDVPMIVNPYYKHNVTLLKVDANDTSKPLKGAKFKIWRDNGDNEFTESEPDHYIGEFETDEYGKIEFSQLRVGTYYFKETYTPSGYAIDSSVHSFHVYSKHELAGGADSNMIQVGLTDGTLVAPEMPNQVTVADRPNPQLPATAGPGIGGLVTAGVVLVGIGAAWFALMYAARRKTGFIRARNRK